MASSAQQQMYQKTRMCKYQKAGHCKKGFTCSFAHSDAEIRTVPDLWCWGGSPNLANSSVCQGKDSTFVYRGDETGAAPGDAKNHAWGFAAGTYWPAISYTPDYFELNNMPFDGLSMIGSGCGNGLCKEKPANTLRKTKFCIFWSRGVCNKGDRCSYAHSKEELRSRPMSNGTEAFWGMSNRSRIIRSFTDSRSEVASTGCSWSDNHDVSESSLDNNSDDLDWAPSLSEPSRRSQQMNQGPAYSQLSVKNTFLHIVDFIPEAPRPRSQSVPCRPNRAC